MQTNTTQKPNNNKVSNNSGDGSILETGGRHSLSLNQQVSVSSFTSEKSAKPTTENEVQPTAQALINQGNKLWQDGLLDEAISTFQQATESDATAYKVHHHIGCIFAKQSKLEEAVAAYNQALEINPNYHWSYHGLGRVLLWQGKWEEAIAAVHRAIEIEPNEASFYDLLGKCLERQGNIEKAISAYQDANKLNPQLSESIYSRLIELILVQDKTDLALDTCAIAVKHYPQSAQLHFQQGNILAIKNRWQEAISRYKKAVEFKSDFWNAYHNLGDVLLKLDRQEEAQQAYELAESKYYQAQSFSKSDLPDDFDWQMYLALNPDFNFSCKFDAISHLMNYGLEENKLYALKHLHDSQKRPDIAPQSIVQSTNQNTQTNKAQSKKLAVLVHIYYFELWPELCRYIQNIETEFDLYINIVASVWQPYMHEKIRADFPEAKILISPNRGRDLGGHLSLMSHLDFAQYDLLYLLHTKKSPQKDSKYVEIWRKDLLDAILGTKEKVRNNIAIMRQNPHIGLLGSRYWRDTNIANNLNNYHLLLDLFLIKKNTRNCEYLSGTMMLVKFKIMQIIYEKLHDIRLESGDKKEFNFHIDGQLPHAIERVIGNVVRDQGFSFFWQE